MEVKISYLKLWALLSGELIQPYKYPGHASPLWGSALHLGVGVEQLKDSWGKHAELLGRGEGRRRKYVAWSARCPAVGQLSHYSIVLTETLQRQPPPPSCAGAACCTSLAHRTWEASYTWSSENSVSRLAAFLWKHIRSTIVFLSYWVSAWLLPSTHWFKLY